MINFVIGGLRTLQTKGDPPEKYAEEALEYVRRKILQHNVRISSLYFFFINKYFNFVVHDEHLILSM
jgi:hypothetical protein